MIKDKQKMQSKQTDADILKSIGDGILKDHESSIQKSKAQEEEPPKESEEQMKEMIGDSTIDVSIQVKRLQTKTNFLLDTEKKETKKLLV